MLEKKRKEKEGQQHKKRVTMTEKCNSMNVSYGMRKMYRKI